MMNLPLYNQNDSRWKGVALGTQGNTVGSHGCTVTALAMAMKNYAIEETPKSVVEKLNVVGGLQPDGSILWSAIAKIWPIRFHWRWYTTLENPQLTYRQNTDTALEKIQTLMALGQPVLLNVDNVGNDKRPDHWVVAKEVIAGELLINDPDGGKEMKFNDKYGDPLKGIYGYTILIGAPIAFAEGTRADLLDRIVRGSGSALWKAGQVADGKNVTTYAKEIIDTVI